MKHITIHKLSECCLGAEYISTGGVVSFDMYPPSYSYFHKCTQCGKNKNFNKKYPHSFIEYEEHEKEKRWE